MSSSSSTTTKAQLPKDQATLQQSPQLRYVQYDAVREDEFLPQIQGLISKDLSEPYSIYVYRYFLYQWGELCFMVQPFLH
jgi:N-alpha-acetyltransferase 30